MRLTISASCVTPLYGVNRSGRPSRARCRRAGTWPEPLAAATAPSSRPGRHRGVLPRRHRRRQIRSGLDPPPRDLGDPRTMGERALARERQPDVQSMCTGSSLPTTSCSVAICGTRGGVSATNRPSDRLSSTTHPTAVMPVGRSSVSYRRVAHDGRGPGSMVVSPS